MAEHNRQTAGVGVFVRNGNKILIGQRGPACRYGAGMMALPGGYLDHPESFVDCAVREVEQETGVVCERVRSVIPFRIPGLLAVTDHFDLSQQRDGNLKDHLTFWMLTDYVSGEPVVREPGKAHFWQWVEPCIFLMNVGDAAENPTHPQFYWTPGPLWRAILRPYFPSL